MHCGYDLYSEGFLTALCSCLHLLCRWICDYTFSVHMFVFVCALILHVRWIFPHVSIWWGFGKRGGKTKTEIGLIFFFITASLSREFYVGASCCWGSSRSASSPRCKSTSGLIKLLPKQVESKAVVLFLMWKRHPILITRPSSHARSGFLFFYFIFFLFFFFFKGSTQQLFPDFVTSKSKLTDNENQCGPETHLLLEVGKMDDIGFMMIKIQLPRRVIICA